MKKYIIILNAKNKKEIDDFKQKKQTEWSQAHATVPENAIVLTSGLSQPTSRYIGPWQNRQWKRIKHDFCKMKRSKIK